ncbi:unnamed protein product [Somion occarium]|uniref:Uncharacterized protein n=1 Tax=Somion occarium TaxID=3059160 RepID=A0ABP1CEJ4_9APHY
MCDYERELCAYHAQTCIDGEDVCETFVEGRLSAAVRICSFSAAEKFVSRISPPIALFKFPRTEHLLNLGAVTDDDLVADL